MTTLAILENPVAIAFGAAGLACQFVWPLLSGRRAILGVQLGIGANYGAQYALLDAWSGAAVCSLGAAQTLIALLAGERAWLRRLGLMFLPGIVGVSLMTWSGLPSFLALSACCLTILARQQQDEIRLRQFMLAAAPFGMSYDISVGAAPALIGACVSNSIALVMLRPALRNSQRNFTR